MQHRKSVQELQLSGKWSKLSRKQRARRLLEEERGMPEGLSAAARDLWHMQQSTPSPTPASELPPPTPPTFDASAEAKAYAIDIISGVIPAGRYHRLAAQRFLDDLVRTDLIFDSRTVQHVFEYVTRNMWIDIVALAVLAACKLIWFQTKRWP